ncbi:hypothetical protein [Pantanalinema sp. GBBB05]
MSPLTHNHIRSLASTLNFALTGQLRHASTDRTTVRCHNLP